MRSTNYAAGRYLCSVWSLLPAGSMKRQIMAQIKDGVLDYLEQRPKAGGKELRKQFGEPQDIAAAHVENMGTAAILKGLRVRRRIMTAICAVGLTVLLVWAAVIADAVIETKNTYDGAWVEVVVE